MFVVVIDNGSEKVMGFPFETPVICSSEVWDGRGRIETQNHSVVSIRKNV